MNKLNGKQLIDNMLLRQGVESNPGPNQADKKFKIKIMNKKELWTRYRHLWTVI